jgi:predicted chitinase
VVSYRPILSVAKIYVDCISSPHLVSFATARPAEIRRQAYLLDRGLHWVPATVEPILGIFISYRKSDSEHAANSLASELRARFGDARVFQDLASIAPGVDFEDAISESLARSAAMIVIIGPNWSRVTDQAGRRRLELPDDWVRREVAAGLSRSDFRVFPVLVGGAPMPAPEELPEALRQLPRRQAFELTTRHWKNDVAELVNHLAKLPALATSGPSVSLSNRRRIWVTGLGAMFLVLTLFATIFVGREQKETIGPPIASQPSDMQPVVREVPSPKRQTLAPMTIEQLSKIMPLADRAILAMWIDPLNHAFDEFTISTGLERAAFMAQVAFSTSQLTRTEENWIPTEEQLRSEPPNGKLAIELGNVEPGDGQRFKHRGLLETYGVYGKASYAKFGRDLGLDLLGHPELAGSPTAAPRLACWFWRGGGLNELADAGKFDEITGRIAKSPGNYEERKVYYKLARDAFGV